MEFGDIFIYNGIISHTFNPDMRKYIVLYQSFGLENEYKIRLVNLDCLCESIAYDGNDVDIFTNKLFGDIGVMPINNVELRIMMTNLLDMFSSNNEYLIKRRYNKAMKILDYISYVVYICNFLF